MLRPDAEIAFLTAGRSVGEHFFAGTDWPRHPLFPGEKAYPKRADVATWLGAFARARTVLSDFRPDVVAGFGSYPTALAAVARLGPLPLAVPRFLVRSRRGPPLVLLEQNAIPGRSVRWLAPAAEKVLLAFEVAAVELPRVREAVVTGNPLPRAFTHGETPPFDVARYGLTAGRPTIVGLGGSQGARGVNEMILAARGELGTRWPDAQVLLLTGEGEHDAVRQAVDQSTGVPIALIPFSHEMKAIYAFADVIVARAGGTTLAELAIVGRPAALVPYPYAADDHQTANARVFEQAGAARIVAQGDAAPQRLLDAIAPWMDDAAARTTAGDAARAMGRSDAAARCAAELVAAAEAAR